jgi:uncharacterized membrane protein YphA (DoxX/SURF4 family)
MAVPSSTKWPHRRTLVLTAIILLLAMGSMLSAGWISSLLTAGAVVLVLVAAVRLWWFWRWPPGPSGSPES